MKSPSAFQPKIALAKRLDSLGDYLFVQVRRAVSGQALAREAIDLSVGDPDQGVSRQILHEAFAIAAREASTAYPSGRGMAGLRRAISQWMDYRYGVRVDPDREVAVLSGSKEGIAHLIHILCNPKDTMLVGSLAYPVYARATSLAGGCLRVLPMETDNNYWLDYSRERKAKAIFINYPNNPTGAMASRQKLADLVLWAREKGVFVISDAAYGEMVFNGKDPAPSILALPGSKGVAVEFHSFSKTFGLPGLRLGWVLGPETVITGLLKLKDTYDSGVSNFIQRVGQYFLEMPARDSELRRLRRLYGGRRSLFEKGLKAAGVPFYDSGATFYVWTKTPDLKFAEILRTRKNLLCVGGEGFGSGGAGYIRFALCSPEAQLLEAIGRIKSALAGSEN